MNSQQFTNLCNTIWKDFTQEMHGYFSKSEHCREYYQKYHQLYSPKEPGVMFVSRYLFPTMIGRREVQPGWLQLTQLTTMCGSKYAEMLNHTENTSYVVAALIMTGSKDYYSSDLVFPSAVIFHCLVKIVKDGNTYKAILPTEFSSNPANLDTLNKVEHASEHESTNMDKVQTQ